VTSLHDARVVKLTRYLALALLVIGCLAALVLLVWLTSHRQPPTESMWREMGWIERGLAKIAASDYFGTLVAALVVAAVAAAGLVVVGLTRWYPWPLAGAALACLPAMVAVWRARDWIAGFEDPRFRARSHYVRGADAAATASTVYLVVLALACAAAAATALIAARRRARPAAAAR